MSADPKPAKNPKLVYPKPEPKWRDPARELPVPQPVPKRELPEHVSPRQVARLLGVHVSCVYRCIRAGSLPARRIGGRRYIVRRDDALRFADGEAVQPRPRIEWPPRETPRPA